MKGIIHSTETFGTVDGPGIRYIVFMQGCPLKCKYCHNRDTWNIKLGKEYTVEELINDMKRYQNYYKFSGGGLTVSGGEPTLQAEFVAELLKTAKSEGFHTCLDTSGFVDIEKIIPMLEYTDLVLLDIKHIDEKKCIELTGQSNEKALLLAQYLSDKNIPTWIRQVLVPSITDDEDDLNKLGMFLSQLKNVELVEVLPYHTMGIHKWENMGVEYELKGIPDATWKETNRAVKILKKYGLRVR
jgi:pyruvate formate lyase activating enzyme